MTRIVRDVPPNYAEIKAAFNPGPTAVFAYGDTIYSPLSDQLPADLIAHERVHFRQQAELGGPDAWWRRYIDDPQFRLEQEVQAYREQYASVAHLPRADRRRLLAEFCRALASRMYGNLVTKERARLLIAGAA